MAYSYFQPNPRGKAVGDCTVRAIAKATGKDWDSVYWGLCIEGNLEADMPSSNAVWGAYLKKQGFRRGLVREDCPECYTVADFAQEHPTGTFILALSGHAVCVEDGKLFDSWDSSGETPLYFWTREDINDA